ncbi:MAG: rhomboid family intramembrane serine protease, partial [Burkholderiaceae bacterium]
MQSPSPFDPPPVHGGNAPALTGLLQSSPARVPVTMALLAVNILIFVAMLFYGASLWHTTTTVPLTWGANFGPATQDGQWWRLGTAMFVHFGIIHLTLNMWALWDIGRLLEQVYGRWRYALLYLASGVLGNLLSLVIQGNQAVSGGASGAIFGLYGALVLFLWRERGQVERGEFRWMFGAATIFIALALVMGQLIPGIDNSAHIGGLFSGALLGVALSRPWSWNSPRNHKLRLAALALVLLAAAGMVQQLPAPSYRLGEEIRAREAISRFLRQDRHISQQWESILGKGQEKQQTFDQLAGQIDSAVTSEYQESFENLSTLHLDTAAPSARTLEILRKYAELRSNASQELSEGLRKRDANQIRKALESARQAPALARGAS